MCLLTYPPSYVASILASFNFFLSHKYQENINNFKLNLDDCSSLTATSSLLIPGPSPFIASYMLLPMDQLTSLPLSLLSKSYTNQLAYNPATLEFFRRIWV